MLFLCRLGFLICEFLSYIKQSHIFGCVYFWCEFRNEIVFLSWSDSVRRSSSTFWHVGLSSFQASISLFPGWEYHLCNNHCITSPCLTHSNQLDKLNKKTRRKWITRRIRRERNRSYIFLHIASQICISSYLIANMEFCNEFPFSAIPLLFLPAVSWEDCE